MTIQTIADLVGAGAAVQIAASGRCRKIFLCAHGSSNARYGDVNVAAARGVELPADTVVTIGASDADPTDLIDLSTSKVYIPNGTTVSVSVGV